MTQDMLKQIVKYDPHTGKFTRKKCGSGQGKNASRPAGGVSGYGYIYIGINGKKYLAHRLAWLYMEGYMPEPMIDHINRNKTDNRISNLRMASKSCNAQNSKIPSDNTSGVRGVWFCKTRKKWYAEVKLHGIKHRLGSFIEKEDAIAARKNWEESTPEWNCN